MKKPKLVKSKYDDKILNLVYKTDKKTLVIWARDCAIRVLKYFEKRYPNDSRPRLAIEACNAWIKTGIFKMKDVRRISLASHTSAREVETNDIARSVARSCGQVIATTHVKTHSVAASIYAATAIYYGSKSNPEIAVNEERKWQLGHLIKLIYKYFKNNEKSNFPKKIE